MKKFCLGAAMALLMNPAYAEVDNSKIGFIYVFASEDFGYNMSMDLGRQYVEGAVEGVSTTAFESIPETAEVERVMERLIQNGHGIIFATSYGYLDYAISVGERFPDVSIMHAGGLKTSDNVGTYWADSDEGMYLAGVAAGHMSESGQLGFVGAFQIPQLFRTINAFTRGAQSVNPDATTTVVWTGNWWDPQREADATRAFAAEGIDVIASQVDSPITISETAKELGVMVIGKDVDISERAGDIWVTGVSWNWGPMMAEMVEQIQADTWEPAHVRGDLRTGHVILDPFGPQVPEDVAEEVLALKDEILAGDFDIWAGPILNQDGETVVAEGETLSMEAVETMGFLAQGVIGSAN